MAETVDVPDIAEGVSISALADSQWAQKVRLSGSAVDGELEWECGSGHGSHGFGSFAGGSIHVRIWHRPPGASGWVESETRVTSAGHPLPPRHFARVVRSDDSAGDQDWNDCVVWIRWSTEGVLPPDV
jgi:hypothetical protein